MRPLNVATYPHRDMIFARKESAVQWLFILFCGFLYALCSLFWGPHSQFGRDSHCARARKVYSGMLNVCHLEKRFNLEYFCLDNWMANATGVQGLVDYEQRCKRLKSSVGNRMVSLLAWFLHVPAACVLGFPNLG